MKTKKTFPLPIHFAHPQVQESRAENPDLNQITTTYSDASGTKLSTRVQNFDDNRRLEYINDISFDKTGTPELRRHANSDGSSIERVFFSRDEILEIKVDKEGKMSETYSDFNRNIVNKPAYSPPPTRGLISKPATSPSLKKPGIGQ